MEKVTVWGSPNSDGCGSVYIRWFLTEEEAICRQRKSRRRIW